MSQRITSQPKTDLQTDAEILDEAVDSAETTPTGEQRGVGGWATSIFAHVILALLFWAAVTMARVQEVEQPPMRISMVTSPPPQEEKPTIRDQDQNVQINITSENETPSPVTTVDVPLPTEREAESDNPTPKGREEAVADSEMGSTGAFMAIGASGGGAGMFGSRSGGGRKRALGRYGGSVRSETAVDAALRWFMRHQAVDGSWDVVTYQNNCTEPGQKCEPGMYERGPTSRAGIVGMVLLCYLGAGYDHQLPSRYRATVKRGVDWMLTQQAGDGSFMVGAYNYEQAIATMAMAETYAMTNDPHCKDAAVKGWNVMMGRRFAGTVDKLPVCGWGDFTVPDAGQSIKTSATSWAVQCIKSMRACGLDVGDAPDGLRNWVRISWEATCKLDNLNPQALDPYKDMTSMAYKYAPGEGATMYTKDGNSHNLPGCSLVSAVFLGLKNGDTQEQTLANYIMAKQVSNTWPTNLYYLYYNTFGIFQMGGDRWKTFNGVVRDLLVDHQRHDPACYDGSWDEGTNFAHEHGRLLSTALSCLSLEVYYRYAIVHGNDADKEKLKKSQRHTGTADETH